MVYKKKVWEWTPFARRKGGRLDIPRRNMSKKQCHETREIVETRMREAAPAVKNV